MEFAPSEHEPCVRCLQLGMGLCQPDFVGALVVSQFTLLAESRRQKGTRPDFSKAARPEVAEPLYGHFCEHLRSLGIPVETGVFGARMRLELVNDGPVTIILDVEPRSRTDG